MYSPDSTLSALEIDPENARSSAVVFITPSGGDDAVAINAALNDPTVTEVRLGEGIFTVHTAIIVPSGKTLTGAGRDATMIRAADDFTIHSQQLSGVVNSEFRGVGITLSDFSVDANKIKPEGERLQGVMMKQAVDFDISRVDVFNATGYAHLAQGDLFHKASGTYDDCRTYNSQVHFEQMYCDGVTLTNCHGRDGDNDISTEAYFHPVAATDNITYIDCTAYGNGFIGFSLASMNQPSHNIRIIGCDIEISRPNSGFGLTSITTLPVYGLEIINSRFVSQDGIGASIAGVTGFAQNSEFRGGVVGLEAGPLNGVPNAFVAYDSLALGVANDSYASAVNGIVNYGAPGEVVWNGGTIEAIGPSGYTGAIWHGSGTITASSTTTISNADFDATRAQLSGGAPLSLFNGVTIDGLAGRDPAGGKITFFLQSSVLWSDELSLVAGGSGDSGLVLQADGLHFNGTLIGTLHPGNDGRRITVELSAAATPEAVAAIAGAIKFSSDPTGSGMRIMPAFIVFSDSSDASFETFVRAVVSPPVLEGTTGTDWLFASDAGHVFNLHAGGSDTATGGAGADTFNFGAQLTSADYVYAGAGVDTIRLQGDYSGARQLSLEGNLTGVEFLTLLSGKDTRYGGSGLNLYSYDVVANDAIVAAGTTLTVDGRALRATETLVYDGSLETNGALQLYGGAGADRLAGGAGGDHLVGWAGNDTIVAGSGNDILRGVTGDDVLEGGSGNDAIYGEDNASTNGNDTVTYAGAAGAVVVNLSTTTATATGADGTDYLYYIDNVIGSAFNDTLIGDGGANVLNGGSGDDGLVGNSGGDSLLGGAGNDTLDGGAGNDALDGGAGSDTASFAGATASVNVNLRLLLAQNTEGAGIDTLTSIENLIGSAFNDTLTGDAGANVLNGGGGDDRLLGNAGEDTLNGGDGNDVLTGSAGADILNGGAGSDHLIGEGENDIISGGSGNDTVRGGTGDDLLAGGLGDDAIYGEDNGSTNGNDTATYASAAGAVVVNMGLSTATATGADGTDYLYYIDNVTGSAFNDTLIGDGGANVLDGGGRNDRLDGGAGNDRIVYDAVDDPAYVNGGDGYDVLTVWNQDAPTGFDLAAHGFELAEVTVIDNGANAWSSVVSTYDSSWALLQQTTTWDDGSTSTTFF